MIASIQRMPTYPTKPSMLIVWHSRTGASQAMAEAAADGAEGEINVLLRPAQSTSVEEVLRASCYLFVCPENLGSMSGAMKEFFDRTYYAALGQIEGRAYATIIAAGSDGAGAQRQIDTIATGWRLRRVLDPSIQVFGAQEAESIWAPKVLLPGMSKQSREIGAALGAGAALGLF